MRRHIARALISAGLGSISSIACAAGGAHVVDDAAVEDAGHYHLESWIGFASGHSGFANLGPACTPRSSPDWEIDAFATHSWAPGTNDTLAGLALKLVLRPESRGFGVAISGSLGYGVEHHRLETASVRVPLTVPANRWLRLNFNLGWQWFGLTHRHDLFVGAQAEMALSKQFNLMVESFGHDHGKPGQQVGLRWTPGKGDIDVDLIGRRYVDGVSGSSVTFGLTFRR